MFLTESLNDRLSWSNTSLQKTLTTTFIFLRHVYETTILVGSAFVHTPSLTPLRHCGISNISFRRRWGLQATRANLRHLGIPSSSPHMCPTTGILNNTIELGRWSWRPLQLPCTNNSLGMETSVPSLLGWRLDHSPSPITLLQAWSWDLAALLRPLETASGRVEVGRLACGQGPPHLANPQNS